MNIQQRSTDFDTVIVGGRIAGSATAIHLAEAGQRVLVVERSQQGSDTPSTHALMRGGVFQLRQLGVFEEVVAGTPAIRNVTFNYNDEQLSVGLRPKHGVDALYAPRRTVLDVALQNRAADLGVEYAFGTRATGLTWTDGSVGGVEIEDGRRQRTRVDADLVVGADGRRSRFATWVSAPTTHATDASGAYIFGYFSDLELDGRAVDRYVWSYHDGNPGHASGLIPTNDGLTAVFAGGHGTAMDAAVRGDRRAGFLAALRAASPENVVEAVERGTPASPLVGGVASPGWLRRPWGPGWALVGDGAYWKDPIGAHGITDALRDAQLLARAVSSGAGLASYEAVRNELSLPLFEATSRIARFDWDIPALKADIRAESQAMAAEVDYMASLACADLAPAA